LVGAKRLDDVVIGARVQRPHHLRLRVRRGDHDDRHRADRPQHPQRFPAVKVRQAEIEQDHLGALGHGELKTGQRVSRRGNRVPSFTQRAHHGGTDRRIILYDQHLDHGITLVGGWNHRPRAHSRRRCALTI
jgi:hypothetical protein